ncbi:acetate/propionate family kinase [Pseudolysinimonas yzui]|uniref:Acetate kinase n=1 Tax=Pseudolysinimonas yzui TaxID=2708254 RepID=A0A8J3LZK8_9MICO|nr:acetate kinase [Pseudolysinimonas yzui]GHF10540.1 acetate kinase [Pseudolysinimonas yzui]
MTRVLVVNAGSSSLKYEVLDAESGVRVVAGLVERIGVPGSPVPDHAAALTDALEGLDVESIDAVGHRIVHGGTVFVQATVIDDAVEAEIERLAVLAPLHNPPGLLGIRAARAALPFVPQVAVFDTAFHATLPPEAYTYAIDAAVAARYQVRRYGFHGTSYRYVTRRAAELLGRPLEQLRQVVLHLGNGASAAAVAGGRSINTSMGMTPLEGLVMGTRSGDLDPAVLVHLQRVGGFDATALDDMLNRSSGLKGLGGHSDMRDLIRAIDSGDEAAALAFEVYVHRVQRYIAAYAADLGGIDALVFTAGVGENSALVRARAVERLGFLGIVVDAGLNAAPSSAPRFISPDGSPVAVLVVPTNEELQIAFDTVAVISGG